jgi:spore germination cell wall hydrolase CwlJ-like protein
MGIETAAFCLALAAYHESRGEPTSGQTAVMYVLLNRAQSTKNVCKELHKPKQFSFIGNVELASKFQLQPYLNMAYNVLHKKVKDPTKGAVYFHRKDIKPTWANNKPVKVAIGNHIFY